MRYFISRARKRLHWALSLVYNSRTTGLHGRLNGVIAQLVARLNGIQKVRGSTPLSSTKIARF